MSIAPPNLPPHRLRYIGRPNLPPDRLVAIGPLVDVVLMPSPEAIENIKSTGAKPPIVSTKLMIDTGAEHTLVEDELIKSLGIKKHNHVSMTGVSQTSDMWPVYLMSIGLMLEDDNKRKEKVVFLDEVVGKPSPASRDEHYGLLGRDFLRHFRFVYDGLAGTFELQVPGQQVSPPQDEAGKTLSRQERRRLEYKRERRGK